MAASEPEPARPIALLLVAATAIVGGGLLGATTNAINGAVSPTYFRTVLRWHDVQDVWRASIAQGLFEGLLYGVLFSVVFTLVVGVVSGARCRVGQALRYLAVIFVSIYACWAAGGLIAMGLATLSPDFYRHAFVGVPNAFPEMLRYAWVGGSIWGAMVGGVFGGVIGSILFAAHWRRTHFGSGGSNRSIAD